MEIGPVSYPASLFASCGRLLYPYADRSRHVWNPSPSLTDDARVRHACLRLFTLRHCFHISTFFYHLYLSESLLPLYPSVTEYNLMGWRWWRWWGKNLRLLAYRVGACAVRERSYESSSPSPPSPPSPARPWHIDRIIFFLHLHIKTPCKICLDCKDTKKREQKQIELVLICFVERL